MSADKGYEGKLPDSVDSWYPATNKKGAIYICSTPDCGRPTFVTFNHGKVVGQYPRPLRAGTPVQGLPGGVKGLYLEAAACLMNRSYTASVMVCRALLMHIAVEKGAEEGKSFAHYVDYLDNQNYFPRDVKKTVNHIRDQGNDANHKIVLRNENDAHATFNFLELLLRNVYEVQHIEERRLAKNNDRTE